MNNWDHRRFMTSKFLVSIILFFVIMLAIPMLAKANEVMTDRCSGDVSFPPAYDYAPTVPGAFILTRQQANSTNWSLPFSVRTDADGRIRWWCHSTTGNWLDPGTWRIDSASIGSKCNDSGCEPTADFSVTPVDTGGWTAERSRCDNRSSVIRARLGSNRLLQIECLGSGTGTTSSRLTVKNCTYGPDTCIRGFVWREANPIDRVCVLPAVRDRTKADNNLAASRRNPGGGAYGPDTCRQGYVWREAFPNDHVCVEPSIRSQAAFDNSRRSARVACK
ncbi:hypothetical protein ACE1CI_23395 [Aerosakkonemataceae cyanobacterium BLCC-F50]|uniref:Uncharacterized protein n=1 Tax=Floridaenema flaviceps BLCC-F50 TaxID=3153642 RepID=A0ABV4XWF8_9CYAN